MNNKSATFPALKILYLVYGPQSGVVKQVSKVLRRKNMHVDIFHVENVLNYRHKRYKIPSTNISDMYNTLLSLYQFKKNWKSYFLYTTYAFKKMTKYAFNHIKKVQNEYDLILQSGVLFAPFIRSANIPYFLYLDHTYQITKKYERRKGLPDPPIVSGCREELEKRVYHSAANIFTMSENVKQSLINDYRVNHKKIDVIGAGVYLEDADLYSQECINKKNRNKSIIFVGKEFYRKGGADLLEAFRLVKKKVKGVQLIIVGPP